jgi:hypothetical protein
MKGFLKPLITTAAVFMLIAFANIGAKADTVTFVTDARFNSGAFGTPITFAGTVQLSFQGIVPPVTVNAPINTSLGEIVVSCVGGGTACAPVNITGTTFSIRITQTVPSAGNAILTSTLSGTIGGNTSDGTITFTVTSATIGGVTYTILNNPQALVPVNINNGHTRIQASIATATVPEPTTMLLLGTGLAGIAAKVRKRRKAV